MADWETAYVLTFVGGAFVMAYVAAHLRLEDESVPWVKTASWALQTFLSVFALGLAMIPLGHLDAVLGENSITNSSLTVTSITSGTRMYGYGVSLWVVLAVLLMILVIWAQIGGQLRQRRQKEEEDDG